MVLALVVLGNAWDEGNGRGSWALSLLCRQARGFSLIVFQGKGVFDPHPPSSATDCQSRALGLA